MEEVIVGCTTLSMHNFPRIITVPKRYHEEFNRVYEMQQLVR